MEKDNSNNEKKDIIEYHKNCQVTCACGNTFLTGATVPSIKADVCSACHPYYTGKSKFLDTAGRIDRFKARLEKHQALQAKDRKEKGKTDAS